MASLSRRPSKKEVLPLALVLFGAAAVVGCSSENACGNVSCASTGVIVESVTAADNGVPAGPAFKMTVSGPACGDLTCDGDGGWLTECQLGMRQGAGTCHIELTFEDGVTYAKDITMHYSDGCCPGWYPDAQLIDTSSIADAGSD